MIKDTDILSKEMNEKYEIENLNFMIDSKKNRNYSIGDIIFFPEARCVSSGEKKENLFVIIDDNNYSVPLHHFCSFIFNGLYNLKKEYLTKENELNRDNDIVISKDRIYIVNADDISFKIGNTLIENVNFYKKYCIKYDEILSVYDYVDRNKNILDTEFKLLEELSRLRKEKNLSQRKLAEMIGMKQPTLAKIEKGKNSPQLNTLLSILNSLNYYIKFEEK